MNCPRCNNALRPGALFCDRCGMRFQPGPSPAPQQPYAAPTPPAPQSPVAAPKPSVPQSAVAAAPQPSSPKKKRGLLIGLLAGAAALVIAFVVVLLTVILPNSRYNAAMELKNAGNYDEAIAAFEAMDGYKDSGDMITDCRYEAAKKLYNTGRYDEAIPAFEALGDYMDSKSLLSDCNYLVALDLYNAGDYENARKVFGELDGYKDSAELLADCDTAIRYDAAMELLRSGSYAQALEAFEALGGFSDSSEQAAACRAQLMRSASIGDILLFGSYEQDNNTADGKEEIEWIVVDKQGDSALLVSRYALDCQMFYPSMANVTWETSSLRLWLNGTFYNNAFSTEEKSQIQSTTVTADWNPSHRTNPGNSTFDKVFLLSISQASLYFTSDSARQCKGTAYCYAQGAYMGTNNNCWWWLRTPGSRPASAATVSSSGPVYLDGNDVDAAAGAVRPAIWISLG